MLGVSVDRPRRLPVWRVGYRPDPWEWTDWRWSTDGRFPGRWDDCDGTFRTIYVGSTLQGCLLEVLADFRPDPSLVDELADVDVDEDDATLFPTISAGLIDPTWLEPRIAGSATLSGNFCQITTAETLAALHPRFVSAARMAGLADFDAAALKDGRPRELTQSVATYLYAVTDLDGVRFASRHGDDLELWAIFERHDTRISPCLDDADLSELTNDHPAVVRAFDLLGLAWADSEPRAREPVAVEGGAPDGESTDPVVTARLVLTPIEVDDLDDLMALYQDRDVAYWTGPWNRATVQAWIVDMSIRWAADGVGKWIARDRADGSLVGRGGFSRVDVDGQMVLELGWAVRGAITGRGYATELGRAALAWAAEHHPALPIVAFTELHNHASRAVMERLGLQQAGVIRRMGLVEGRPGLHSDAPFALYRL